MSRRTIILWQALAWLPLAGNAQTTQNQIRPEWDLYLHPWEAVRFQFQNSYRGAPDTGEWQTYFSFFIQTALKPVLRRELRNNPDVYRNRYLTMRAGYRYSTGIGQPLSTPGNTAILELTPRYQLPWRLFLSDRNRGDFRFPHGQPFYARYRNRLQLERDVRYRRMNFTPYIYDEIYYDTRYDRWSTNRYAAGIEFPVNAHLVLEPYYLRQHNTRSKPPHVNALGFKVNLFF